MTSLPDLFDKEEEKPSSQEVGHVLPVSRFSSPVDLKNPDLRTPIAHLPQPNGSSLHLTLYLVHILKWGVEEEILCFKITHNFYKREFYIPGAPANIPHWIWSFPSPSLYLVSMGPVAP